MKIKEILARKSSEQQTGVSKPGLVETKLRILQLIKEAEAQFAGTGKAILDIEDYVAEYLAANGVIAPPCKVGDKVYSIMETSCEDIDGVHTTCEFYKSHKEDLCALRIGKCPYQYRIEECLVTDANLLLFTARWGKTAFPNNEQAEQALQKIGLGE